MVVMGKNSLTPTHIYYSLIPVHDNRKPEKLVGNDPSLMRGINFSIEYPTKNGLPIPQNLALIFLDSN